MWSFIVATGADPGRSAVPAAAETTATTAVGDGHPPGLPRDAATTPTTAATTETTATTFAAQQSRPVAAGIDSEPGASAASATASARQRDAGVQVVGQLADVVELVVGVGQFADRRPQQSDGRRIGASAPSVVALRQRSAAGQQRAALRPAARGDDGPGGTGTVCQNVQAAAD